MLSQRNVLITGVQESPEEYTCASNLNKWLGCQYNLYIGDHLVNYGSRYTSSYI